MNPFKWLVCWWHRRHVPFQFVRADGKTQRRCIRCGGDLR